MALSELSLQPPCHGLTDLFFDDDESLETIYECRTVCFTCPTFETCSTKFVRNYPNVKDGIFAGYPASTRKAIYEGTHEFVDWRSTWDPDRHVVEGLAPAEIKEPCLRHDRLKSREDGSLVCVECGSKVRLLARR